MTTTVRPFVRVPCPVCAVPYQRRVDGTVRRHRTNGVPCLGGGMRP